METCRRLRFKLYKIEIIDDGMAIFEKLFRGKEKPKVVKKRKVVKVKPQKIRKVVKREKRAKPKPIKAKPVRIKKYIKRVKPAVKRINLAKAEVIPKAVALKMPDEEAFDIVKRYRIPVVPHALCKKEKDLATVAKKIGFPVVMKVSSRSIIHKSEVSGVKTNISNLEEAVAAFKQLIKIKDCESVLVQKQLSGIELIVGAKADTNFGHIVSVGLGGVYVEILKDIAFRVCPVTKLDAEQMVSELKGHAILVGARGAKAIKFDMLYDVIANVSKLAVAKKIKELDINPLFCNENGCWATDIRIVK